eukprot:gene18573-20435_t
MDKEEIKEKFYKYIAKAKNLIKENEFSKALVCYERAFGLSQSKKLEQKIIKLKKFIEALDDSDDYDEKDGDDVYTSIDGLKIFKDMWGKLYVHQQEGVKWLWNLFMQKRGGILGDDMGLGKTIQIIAFLTGMFDAEKVKHVLIVMPVSLIANWSQEFESWAPGIRLAKFHGAKNKRDKELLKIQNKTGIVMTSYGMLVSNCDKLGTLQDRTFIWDYIILDEGHKIKNPTKTTKCAKAIPAKNHLILTGTPVQNNLMELWSLVDFITKGGLLGTSKTFKTEFETPIVRARERDATDYEKKMGNQISATLTRMIKPFFLQRTKKEVFGNVKEDDEPDCNANEVDNVCKKQDFDMTEKRDIIIWLFLTEIQLDIYKNFLQLDNVKEVMRSTRSPLADLTMLKKIADHPKLLSSHVCQQLGLNHEMESEDVLLQESSKLQFTLALVKHLKQNGHRILVFSQSRKMLDIVDKILTHENIKVMRFDGRITNPDERQKLINTFQSDQSYTCCLLTTQVGAVGLNLTGANRVIIFDPSWNPGSDAQAVDRAYRIGQRKDVIVYRLITCGSIEEKIYRKQIFKMSISNQATGASKDPYRYFARNELRDLFILEDPRECITYGILEELHPRQHVLSPTIKQHFDFLNSLGIYGISDHCLLYSKEAVTIDNDNDHSTDVEIIERAKRAEELVLSEKNICAELSELCLNEKVLKKSSTDPTKCSSVEEVVDDIGTVEDKNNIILARDSICEPVVSNVTEIYDDISVIPETILIDDDDSDDQHDSVRSIDDCADVVDAGHSPIVIKSSDQIDKRDLSMNVSDLESKKEFESEQSSSPKPQENGTSNMMDDYSDAKEDINLNTSSECDKNLEFPDISDKARSLSSSTTTQPIQEDIDLFSDEARDSYYQHDSVGSLDDYVDVVDAGCSPIVIKSSDQIDKGDLSMNVSDLESKEEFESEQSSSAKPRKCGTSSMMDDYSDAKEDINLNTSGESDKNLEFPDICDKARSSGLSATTQPIQEDIDLFSDEARDSYYQHDSVGSIDDYVDVVDVGCSPIVIKSSDQIDKGDLSMNVSDLESKEEFESEQSSFPKPGKNSTSSMIGDYSDAKEDINLNTSSECDKNLEFPDVSDKWRSLSSSATTQPMREDIDLFSDEARGLSVTDLEAMEADTVLLNQSDYDDPGMNLLHSGTNLYNLEVDSSYPKVSPCDLDLESSDLKVDSCDPKTDMSNPWMNPSDLEIATTNPEVNNYDCEPNFRDLELNNCEVISDETESEDEVLVKSRRSLRKSILQQHNSSLDNSIKSFDSSIDAHDADTVSISEPDPLPPLWVWNKPFYKRCPGKPSKDPSDSIQDFAMADTVQLLQESHTWLDSPLQNETKSIPQAKRFECPNGEHDWNDEFNRRPCKCLLNIEKLEEYEKLIEEGECFEIIDEPSLAADSYMKALDISDHDLKIQEAVCSYALQSIF